MSASLSLGPDLEPTRLSRLVSAIGGLFDFSPPPLRWAPMSSSEVMNASFDRVGQSLRAAMASPHGRQRL